MCHTLAPAVRCIHIRDLIHVGLTVGGRSPFVCSIVTMLHTALHACRGTRRIKNLEENVAAFQVSDVS